MFLKLSKLSTGVRGGGEGGGGQLATCLVAKHAVEILRYWLVTYKLSYIQCHRLKEYIFLLFCILVNIL